MKLKHERPKVQIFLAAIRRYPNIVRAAAVAKIAPSTHYRRYDREPEYRQAFDRCWRFGCGRLRDHAIDLAHFGYPEPVVYKGKFQYDGKGKNKRLRVVYKIPQQVLLKVLSAEIPDTYGEKLQQDTKHQGQIEVIVRSVLDPKPE